MTTKHATTEEEMMAMGRQCAAVAKPGSVWWLSGDLGAGKTHWTKGFVAGLDCKDEVTSPTFGLLHEYTDGKLPVFHYDLYRLKSACELLAMGWDETLERGGVVVVEWGDKFPELMPEGAVQLKITVLGDGSRQVKINGGTGLANLP